MTEIVVFAPGGLDVQAALPDLAAAGRITVIRWAGEGARGDDEIELAQSAASRKFVARLSRFLPGRMLVRVLPLDSGARFWRATAKSAAVAERVHAADLLVAAERDAGFAVWKWLKRIDGQKPAAVRGFPAARAWQARRTSA